MRVSLEDLRPEMILTADLTDGVGRLLLPSGTALTEKHLRYCQMWGVAEAEIQGDDRGEGGADVLDPAILQAAEAKLLPRFRHTTLAHPFIATIIRHCTLAAVRKEK